VDSGGWWILSEGGSEARDRGDGHLGPGAGQIFLQARAVKGGDRSPRTWYRAISSVHAWRKAISAGAPGGSPSRRVRQEEAHLGGRTRRKAISSVRAWRKAISAGPPGGSLSRWARLKEDYSSGRNRKKATPGGGPGELGIRAATPGRGPSREGKPSGGRLRPRQGDRGSGIRKESSGSPGFPRSPEPSRYRSRRRERRRSVRLWGAGDLPNRSSGQWPRLPWSRPCEAPGAR